MWYLMLFFLVVLPSYFFIRGIRKKNHRKINLILASLLSLPLLFVISNEVGYQLLQKDLTKASIQLFEKNYGIPEDEIIMIEPMESRMKHNMNMEITTKKDFANWQEQVKQTGEFLTGEKIPSDKIDEIITQVENCEISYDSSYHIDGQTDYNYPYSKLKYKKNSQNDQGVGVGVSTGKNNLPEVIRLSKRLEETKKRLTEFYAYPPLDKEMEEIFNHALIPENHYSLDE